MKRRELLRHLRAPGCRLLREGARPSPRPLPEGEGEQVLPEAQKTV